MNRKSKNHTANRLLNQIIVYSLLMLSMVGVFGVVTVWMRHQTTRSANNLQAIEQSILRERRALDQLDVELTIAMSTDRLIALNDSLNLGLREPANTQIVHVTENVEARLYEKMERNVLTASVYAGN